MNLDISKIAESLITMSVGAAFVWVIKLRKDINQLWRRVRKLEQQSIKVPVLPESEP